MKGAQTILEKHGIDWLKGKEHLTWAPNKGHSIQYAEAVFKRLAEADALGGKQKVLSTLDDIALLLQQGIFP